MFQVAKGPTQTVKDALLFNPDVDNLDSVEHTPNARAPLTNGQRLARGLSPKQPRFAAHNGHHGSGSKKSHKHAARDLRPRQSPAPCVPVTGRVAVARQAGPSNAAVNGFVAAVPNRFGEYQFTEDPTEALQVRFCPNDGAIFDLPTLNGVTAHPFLGLVSGFANSSPNLRAGSSNYAYLAGVSQTAPGSPPQTLPNSFTDATRIRELVESAIWSYDPATRALSALWFNTDGSPAPATTILYVPTSDAFAVTGDAGAFLRAFGNGQVAVRRLHCVKAIANSSC
ncbi:hypothetical protein K474DRAFT_1603949 [Panus rudis PR-1116 ss-1]|nr:hypothetical protein K474DRAFT_1603949 [Panus rudis PR-1116 ss-1]